MLVIFIVVSPENVRKSLISKAQWDVFKLLVLANQQSTAQIYYIHYPKGERKAAHAQLGKVDMENVWHFD